MNEIEVTPEMRQAGVDWVDNHAISECSTSHMVEAVYRAMERVRLSQSAPFRSVVTQPLAPGMAAMRDDAAVAALKCVRWAPKTFG
jgi:hypothetical protein